MNSPIVRFACIGALQLYVEGLAKAYHKSVKDDGCNTDGTRAILLEWDSARAELERLDRQ